MNGIYEESSFICRFFDNIKNINSRALERILLTSFKISIVSCFYILKEIFLKEVGRKPP